jgi:hypothetical protein
MAITNGYLTREEFQALLGNIDEKQVAAMDLAIEGASRWIDDYCGRTFYAQDAVTRYYTPRYYDMLQVDDLRTVTSLQTDEDEDGTYEFTWASTDYYLDNYDNSELYSLIRVRPNGAFLFPRGARRSVKIIGNFGPSAVPRAIAQACHLQANRFMRRKDSPFGVMGSVELGQLKTITKVDPDVQQLLAPYRRLDILDI